ncbi:phage minor capsid protein [Limosilactobacillus fermentum]|uniref:phage minor capsid protein n=1 Tax=Limosilactobacillus fermentum TaxID=1613 RepID=UPI00290567B4|nr:phage minor capsid protein [Limosilactobacillus fermentum]
MANRLEHKGLTAGTFCSRTSQASVRTINHSMIPDEAIKNGKLFQQQRARERAIRDAKKRLRVAEQLGDDQMVSQAKTLLRSRHAKPRDFGTSSKRPTPARRIRFW